MSSAAPFSGLIEMPDTGPPATDSDVESAETGDSGSAPSSSGFKSFWQNHQMIMMVIGLGVLLLTAVLVFRKSASNNAANNTTAGGGVPTTNTSDTSTAIDQQNNAIEALMQAFQQWMAGQQQQNPPPTPNPNPPPTPPPGGWPTGEWTKRGLPTYGPDQRTYVQVGSSGTPNTLADIAKQLGISLDKLASLNQSFTTSQQLTAGTYVRTGGTAPWEWPSSTSFLQASLPTTQSTIFGTSQMGGSNVTNVGSK